MPKPPRDALEKVIEKKMPGYKIVPKKPSRAQRDSSRPAKSDTPDIEALRSKYLRRSDRISRGAAGRTGNQTRDTRGGDDVAIVAVEPKDRSRDGQLPGGRRAKRVVVSRDTDEIIGEQG